MQWTAEECYRAVQSRDARFDGLFFTCVHTTKIYCRPVCPARPPHLKNCTFVPSPAQAELLGFRPCLRCRPELAPLDSTHHITAAVQLRRHIDESLLVEESLQTASSNLGYSERHLRRLFLTAFGVEPRQYLTTRRLLFAKQLLQDTRLPIFDVALAAGFNTPGRLTINMRESYGFTPQQLRRETKDEVRPETLTLKAAYRPPLDWDLLLRILKARATPLEIVADGTYTRLEDTHRISVANDASHNRLLITIPSELAKEANLILHKVRRLFDLDANPSAIGLVLNQAPQLSPLLERHPGIRIPGAWDPFELLIRVIIGQQISVVAATTIMTRLVNQHTCDPKALATRKIEDLSKIGLTTSRSRTIIEVSRRIADGSLSLTERDPDRFFSQLVAISGIGPWTAEYLRLRVLRYPDAFPLEDLAIRKALGTTSNKQLQAMSEPWRPWRGYATMLLWQSTPTNGG